MKKLLALVLAIAMMLSCASALAYNGAAPIAEETVKFSLLSSNGGSKINNYQDWTWWNELLKKANVEIEYEMIDNSSYADVVKPRLAAGRDLPDLIKLNGSFDEFQSYIDAGLLMDLTEMYETLGVNYKAQFEKNPALKGSITTVDGGMYLLPYLLDTESNMRCLIINRQYCEALGMKVEDIKTMDDYYKYLVAVKENDVNGNGDPSDEIPLFMRAGMIQLWGMMWGLDLADGAGYQVRDGKVVNGYTDDRYLDMLTTLNKWYQEGLLYNEFPTANLDAQQSLFASDRIGSILHFVSNSTGYSQKINPEWNFDTDEPIMVPTVIEGPFGDTYTYGRNARGGIFAISADCENPEEVFAFCDYLQSEEAGIMTWYGLEGVDYNLVDGEYEFTPVYKENKDSYASNAGYNADHLPSYQYSYLSRQCVPIRNIIKDKLSNYVMNPTVVSGFNSMEETETLNMYRADLDTYFQENMVGFIMGTRPLSDWESYKATVEAMGVGEVLAVHQAVYDRTK